MKKISFAIIVIILMIIPCLSWPPDISPEDVDLTASLETLPPDLSVSSESTQLKLMINLFNNSNKPLVNIDNGDSGNFYFYTVYIYTPPDYRYEIFNYPEANSSQFLMGGDSRTLNLALNSLKNYLLPSDIESYLSPTDLGKNRLTIADGFMYSGKTFPAAIEYYFSKNIKDENKTFYVIFSYYQMKFNNIISWAKVIPIEMTPKQKLEDPKRVKVAVTKQLGVNGERVSDLVKDMGAIAGINGGGFYDPDGKGNGAYPDGLTVHDGKLIHNNVGNKAVNMIALDKEGNLTIGDLTAAQLQSKNIQEAVHFEPNLIVNGKKGDFSDAPYGYAPRTAIGQKADGTIIFLVIDGRQALWSMGANMSDLYNIFQDYGAVNAVNLDGGSSSELVYDGKVQNKLWDIFGERYIPTAFVVTPQ